MPSGNGYWLVTNTGNVYTFGDANYFGAPGNTGTPVTSAVRTPDGGGYWILLANGVVAPTGTQRTSVDPLGLSAVLTRHRRSLESDGAGYWVASANGGVFTLGNAPIWSAANLRLNGSIIAATGW